ncbi:MAG: BatA domain-containing protein [Janthinobacterium lividum]
MFTLTSPSALLALLGLLVPLAIYLWNRRPGPEVAVGSLRWLAAGANRRLRNLKPEQLALLLLRAAVLGALAVAVAGPAWRQGRPAGRGQVLVGPELAGTPALAAARPGLDSLRRRGYALRWLAPGLPVVAPDSLGHYRGPAAGNFAWARVQQAADSFPSQPLRVLVSNTLHNLAGPHPLLLAAVRWQLLAPGAPAATWLAEAAGTPDSLRLLVGRSTAIQTTFQTLAVARPAGGAPLRTPGLGPLRYLTAANGTGQLRPASAAPGPGVAVAGPLRAVLYATPSHAEEARYLRAALQAAALGMPAPLQLATATAAPAPSAGVGWLFWLSDAPVPAAWRAAAARGAHVWQAAAGPSAADTTQLVAPGAAAVALFRRAKGPALTGGAPLWTDGRDRPVLARQAVGQGAIYQLTTRLQPAWGELADSPILPTLLLEVLRPAPDATSTLDAHDQRRFDPAQLLRAPGPQAMTTTLPVTAFTFSDLRPWLVLLAALLLAVERWVARRAAASFPTSAA